MKIKKDKLFENRWLVKKEIGNGGQANVWKVCDSQNVDSKYYALKFLKSQKDLDRRRRMFTEVSNIKKLKNEHLIDIIESNINCYEDTNINLYYISNFIDGITLEEYCNNTTITFEESIAFFKELLNVLSYCHEQGIVHRDIKPDNILICDNNIMNFVLIDFGLSFNQNESESLMHTPSLQQLGNRFIILPELVSGTKEEKRSTISDITQACGVYFYLLTSTVPNALLDGEGHKPHQRAEVMKRLSERISDTTKRENIVSIFNKGFEQNVSNRFNSAEEIIEILNHLDEKRVDINGGNIMNSEFQLQVNSESLTFSELISHLNPNTEWLSPSGLQLPLVTNVKELIPFGRAVPKQLQERIIKYYDSGDYATSAEKIWQRSINVLRKRVLSLGEDFVADMLEINDNDYIQNIPAYTLICLAQELGFINESGKQKMLYTNDIFNHFQNFESDEYEDMPQDEANIIIKNSISYILYSDTDNFGWQFNDFRNKLKTCRISDMYDDVDAMFSTCPYFYLKISVRSLLNLFKETEGIEFENVTTNITLLFPRIWDKLKIEERRALGDTFVEYDSKNDTNKISALKKVMLKVKGFDYVGENVRSRTFITVAKKLKEIHFGFDNFYNEPNQIKILEGLGSTIPQLALKECLTAILFVKIGNSYGRSRAAQPYADKILSRLTVEDWTVYLEKYIKDETDLLYYIQNCTSTRKNWKEIVKEYDLKSLNLANPIAKSIIK